MQDDVRTRSVALVAAAPGAERTAPDGWTAARTGDTLRETDAIRTAEGSTVEIALGRASRLTVAERSELSVRELTAAAQRVKVLRGRIGVEIQPDGTRVLRVEDRSGLVTASVSAGRFGFVASGESLAVAASEGQARLESGGATVDVPAGTETVAWRGAAPLAPRPIPRDLVLRVASRIGQQRSSHCAEIQVDVASELSVEGQDVAVPADGKVVLRAPRGRRFAEVVLRHATGAVERRRVACAEREGDVSELEVRWHGG